MYASNKVVKPSTSVLERTKQFESLSHPAQQSDDQKSEGDPEEDSDGEGLDFAELVRNITSESQATTGVSDSDALQEAFKILDCDEDGFISVADLRTALKMFKEDEDEDVAGKDSENEEEEEDDEAELKEMIAEADFDDDGQISFDDFLKVLTKPEVPEEPEPIPENDEQFKEKDRKKRKKGHRKNAK
uniref:calmodulin-like protein 4 n=1 Tax=Styela clava TaxID=7725 RepID=UPI0019393614|nr:calmodulin-like protein 4 [Styela clava]